MNRFSDEGEDPFVGSDDLLGGQLATAHLIDLGHTRIGHLAGNATVSTGLLRRRGYLAAHAAADLDADQGLIVEAGYTEESGAAAARRLLAFADPPTAVFAVTDMVALGTAEVARQMGFRIPEDLAIVGYNDIPLASRMNPGLTTMHVPIHEFGSAAARLLLDQIESEEPNLAAHPVHPGSHRPRVDGRRRWRGRRCGRRGRPSAPSRRVDTAKILPLC